jgi:hypothetical protein
MDDWAGKTAPRGAVRCAVERGGAKITVGAGCSAHKSERPSNTPPTASSIQPRLSQRRCIEGSSLPDQPAANTVPRVCIGSPVRSDPILRVLPKLPVS